MKKIISILTLFVVLISCEKKETPLVFDTKTYNPENLDACDKGMCPVIAIERLTASGNGDYSDTINKAIEQVLVNTLTISPEDTPDIKTLDQALANFITSYRTYRNDFPETATEYDINSKSQISYESENVLSIIFDNYSYWGGAHGYGSTTYINFDKGTLETISLEDLNKIPEGYNNNIFWNIAHLVATQQILVYKFSNVPVLVSDEIIDKYRKGTKPEADASQAEVDEIKELL